MSTIGVRELARHASSIINDIEQKKEPALHACQRAIGATPGPRCTRDSKPLAEHAPGLCTHRPTKG